MDSFAELKFKKLQEVKKPLNLKIALALKANDDSLVQSLRQ
jgi:hypothetical protein